MMREGGREELSEEFAQFVSVREVYTERVAAASEKCTNAKPESFSTTRTEWLLLGVIPTPACYFFCVFGDPTASLARYWGVSRRLVTRTPTKPAPTTSRLVGSRNFHSTLFSRYSIDTMAEVRELCTSCTSHFCTFFHFNRCFADVQTGKKDPGFFAFARSVFLKV
jgi:hypothetical protein